MAIRAGVRVRILKGPRKGLEDTVKELREGQVFLNGDDLPYSPEMLQEIV